MPKTKNYKQLLINHIFDKDIQTPAIELSVKPIGWVISIHEGSSPAGVTIQNSYRTNAKSVIDISTIGWSVNAEGDAVVTDGAINFDFVPQGENWLITHYIIWAKYSDTNYLPVYYGEFSPAIALAGLQLLRIDAAQLEIIEG